MYKHTYRFVSTWISYRYTHAYIRTISSLRSAISIPCANYSEPRRAFRSFTEATSGRRIIVPKICHTVWHQVVEIQPIPGARV